MSEVPIIFVVDDDPSFRRAVMRLLRAGGYEARDYPSVSELLEVGPGNAHGCVLADLRMPGQSGLDLQRLLIEAKNPIPIIFLSGHGDIPTTVRAMQDGAVDFLTKPVKKEKLFNVVARALAHDAEVRARCAQVDAIRKRFESLTTREREVLTHVIAGKLNKQIAYDLGTSERTIKAHRASITTKLQVQSVAEMVRLAQALDIEPAL